MPMENQLAHAITQTEYDSSYDKAAKKLLANKQILAQIMKGCVNEYSDCTVDDIVEKYIEGTPEVGSVGVHVDDTNRPKKSTDVIKGSNNEDSTLTEGTLFYDVRFDAIAPKSADSAEQEEVIRLIINVEAQKDEPGSYQILNRAIFYVSRLISSQKERDFVKSNYNDIKTVYSIWVCMNMPENSMCHIYLTKEDLLGKHNWKGNLNLVNIVMIGLTNALPESHNEYGLHRLLCAMFSNELSQQQKMKIMEQEYHIPMEESFKEEVSIMCNLSQGIKEAGIAEGREAGIVEGKQREIEKVVLNMHKKGYSLEQIMDATELEEIELKSMIKKLK